MAPSAPSRMFSRLVNVWRDLSYRSDVDDIVLETLGRFSLDKIYAETSADRQSYQRLIVTLLTQLNAIFYIQRLTLPPASDHVGARLGLLLSWEVAMRTLELLLNTIIDGREGLWDRRLIIDKNLGQLLTSGLHFLILHPSNGSDEDAHSQADRFARIHQLLEQVLDGFPGPKSVWLMASRDVCSQLSNDPRAFADKPRQNLPNLASEMYPLPDCLAPHNILELVSQIEGPENWVEGIFALRDAANFTCAALIQYTVNMETRELDLTSSSRHTRDAVYDALDKLPLPSYVSKPALAAGFTDIFGIGLPETLTTYDWDDGEDEVNEIAYSALEMLCTRLGERQVLHRISDGAVTHSVSQVLDILTPSGSSSSRFGAPAGLYVVNCPQCHSFDAMQMRSYNVHFIRRSAEEYITLPAQSTCLECKKPITFAREIALFRRTWELLRHLETDTRASTIERHVSTHFQLRPLSRRGTDSHHSQAQSLHSPMSPTQANITTLDFAAHQLASPTGHPNITSPTYPEPTSLFEPHRPERLTSDSSLYTTSGTVDRTRSISYANTDSPVLSEPRQATTNWASRRRSEATPDKSKSSRWKFSLSKKPTQPTIAASADSSSLSSGGLETQKLEEIPLDGLFSVQKSSKGKKVVNTYVSTTSSLVLFWAQTTLQIWDASTSPPSMVQAMFTESPCLLAAVGTSLVAYIMGSREQKLTLRIASLADPAAAIVEYRMPSTQWCRSIAIDPIENYVAVGFDGAVVRFYKTRTQQTPREERLHGHIHSDCKNCAAVGTLSFSPDGLALLASTRSPKTGVIQLYLWRFPFLECNELLSCRYPVPLYESEDSGVSSVMFKSGADGEEDAICITTWTQSGTPILVNPETGHKTPIKPDGSGSTSKLGTRIQCAAFSPSPGQLAVVNNKGHLYLVSYQSSPMEIRRLATSKDLPAKTNSFGMNFISEHGDDYIVLAWADATKKAGWVKKIPVVPQLNPANRLDEVIELAQYPMGTTITEADLAGSFSLSGTSISATQSNSQLAELPVQEQMVTELEASEPAPTPMSPSTSEPVRKTPTKIPGFS